MAERGEILRLKRRVGFGEAGAVESFVVLQEERIGQALGLTTTIAAPLAVPLAAHDAHPGLVRVSAAEAGADGPRVVALTHLGAFPLDRFESGVAGRLSPATLRRADRVLKLLLGLR